MSEPLRFDENKWGEFFHQWGKVILILVVILIIGLGLASHRLGMNLTSIALWGVPAIAIWLCAARSFDRPVRYHAPVIGVLALVAIVVSLAILRIAYTPKSYSTQTINQGDNETTLSVPNEQKTLRFAIAGHLAENETTAEFRLLVSRGNTRDLIIQTISMNVQQTPAMGGAMTQKTVTRRSISEHVLNLSGDGPLVIKPDKFPPTLHSLYLEVSPPRLNIVRIWLLALMVLVALVTQTFLSKKKQYTPLCALATAAAAYALALKTWNFDSPLMYFVGAALIGGLGGLAGWVVGGITARLAKSPSLRVQED